MRVLFTAGLLFACAASAYSQIDTPRLPNETYSQYILHPETKLANLSYNYSGKWDLDGDQKTDSLYFSGNGGAHAYFFLRVILSSDSKIRDFTFIQIDFPLIQNKKLLLEAGRNPALQFVPDDFNNDGITDLYLNFDNTFSRLPDSWKKNGIKAKYVLLSFKKGRLSVNNP